MSFPLDPHETLRLRAIQSLGAESWLPAETLDRITAYARDHFRVPICLVTLIEAERLLILSRQGLDVRETKRNVSFCTHAIARPDVFVIPDARKDERFKDNPLVTGEPFIRFYAGAPLAYEGDIRLGALCLIDSKPRTMSRGEQAELMMLADHVVSVITSRAFGLPEPDISLALQQSLCGRNGIGRRGGIAGYLTLQRLAGGISRSKALPPDVSSAECAASLRHASDGARTISQPLACRSRSLAHAQTHTKPRAVVADRRGWEV